VKQWLQIGSNNSWVFVMETMLKPNEISHITTGEASPEKAGVGGSIPSLATTF
jgi:hypothetical protein